MRSRCGVIRNPRPRKLSASSVGLLTGGILQRAAFLLQLVLGNNPWHLGGTMSGAIRGLAEIVLMVKDMSPALHFCRDVRGLEVISTASMQGPKFLRVGAAGP